MKRTAWLAFVSVTLVVLLGWMLTTPILKINHWNESPAVADGGMPVPPPPFSVSGVMLADGGMPVPPPPFSVSGVMLADGGMPVPPPPFSVVNGVTLADGGMPVPPPPFSA